MSAHRIRPLAVLLLALASGRVQAQVDARMLRQPAVSATQIAFVYGGDIWVVPKIGGVAERLTSARGEESFPKFSPDGTRLAFTGAYDGNQDVYVIPARGGDVTRVTYHPAIDRVAAWYPDGSALLIASSRTSETNRYDKLFRVSAAGGLPVQLPMPYGEFGTFSPDAKQVAYLPEAVDARTWKRYRGGWAPDIWIYDLEKNTARNITHDDASDAQPMWHGNTIYFLSDRATNMRGNIWAYDTQKDTFRQLTHFTDFDVKYPSIGPSDIVFQAGSRLYLLDLASEQMHEVQVRVVTDRSTLRPQPRAVAGEIAAADISPTGKRALFQAHGDVFTVPAENGLVHDLTGTSGAAERTPQWSPDGKSVAYWSDRTGEYQLTIRDADGTGAERTVTHLGPGFRYTPWWSGDGKRIAFVDEALRIQVVDVATGKVTPVDQALYWSHGDLQAFRPSWSADGRWLAYSRDVPNQHGAIFLWDATTGKTQQATSGYFDDTQPAFDPEGKYLYFLSGRSLAPSYSDLDNTWIYANTTNVVAVPLRADVPSPLAPRNDEEPAAADRTVPGAQKEDSTKRRARETLAAARDSTHRAPTPVAIDVDGFERRAVVLPAAPGNYTSLSAVAGRVLYRRTARTGTAQPAPNGGPPNVPTPIVAFDLNDREEKTLVENAAAFVVSADGKKMLVRAPNAPGAAQGGGPGAGPDYYIVDTKPAQKLEKKLALGGMSMVVDPAAEWHQIFDDAWRVERDYFYDPGMHGVDWNAMRARYRPLIDDAVSRSDVNFVLGELIAEINSSHTYVGGGDVETGPRRGVGLLGADFALENGAYRIARIVDGGQWDSEVRSPLLEPGIGVRAGDYLLAVNGRPVDTTKEPAAALDGLANTAVALTVNARPTMDGARVVLVKTLGDEGRLRNLAWIESNRKRVDSASHGRIGYVYVPSTGIDGQTELVRQYRAQVDRDGMIIDERFNSGGQIPDRFVELLDRPVTNYWKRRNGPSWQWPPVGSPGPKAMLVNGWSGSGGDAFPYYFKQAGLGPLIGMRTWGGLIGISGTPSFVDGGSVTAPDFAIYSTKREWIIENHGVDPDIAVVDDPALMARGRDPQLERAIQEVMTRVQAMPKPPAAPPYPKRTAPEP